jgi:hypothetical protein
MATFTITTTQNIDELAGKTGGDVYNINGGTLNIDQHSRFGLNNNNSSATAATSMGNITLSATLGGIINFDGRFVRLIQYTGGSGTLPALNSLVTQGSASGKLMCVYSSLTAAPVTTGTIPATGWIMIKQWNSVEYSAGAITLSGITASSSGTSVTGFLEIFGDLSGTCTVNRLNQFNVLGDRFLLGTTNGTAGQTFQVPNHGTERHIAGVYIEKTVGSNDYEFYANGGTTTTTTTVVATGTEAARGKIVWINATGLVTIGNSGGTGLNGFVPVSGLKVVVPNVFFSTCLTTTRNVETIPNATLATRYDFTTNGGGVINIDKAHLGWYPSFTQPFSVSVTESAVVDALLISECASSMTLAKVGVGNKATTALGTAPLTISLCYEGGTISECVFQRAPATANNSTSVILTDIAKFNFTNCTLRYSALRGFTLPINLTATRVVDSTFTNTNIVDAQVSLVTCTNVTFTNTNYINAVVGTTGTANPCTIFLLSTACLNTKIDGITFPIANNHPYTGIVSIGVAGCANTKIRNIGTRASPLNLGTTNASGIFLTLASNAAALNTRVQRVYTVNSRTGFYSGDNSSTQLYLDNCYDDYANSVDISSTLNMLQRGNANTKAYTASQGLYGTHWIDHFQSTTAGRLVVLMNEPTSLTTSQVTLSGGSAFTSAGTLYMPTIGMYAIFEMPYYMLGHTQFANSSLVMAGGTAGNYTYAYQVSTGGAFSSWSAELSASALGTSLNALGALNPATGVKLKLRLTTSVTNATAISSVYVSTISTAVAQDNEYPLDSNTISFIGLPIGTDVVILQAGSSTILSQNDSIVGTSFLFTYSGAQIIDVGFIKEGYVPKYIRNLALSTSDSTLPVELVSDRNFS